jgi:hypothetical protein
MRICSINFWQCIKLKALQEILEDETMRFVMAMFEV